MESAKAYIKVTASFSEDGVMTPLSVTWEDGREYIVDRVLDVRPAAAMKAGGQGDRYAVRILGKQTYLFFERDARPGGPSPGKWFVERRQ